MTKDQIAAYLEETWNSLEKFERDFVAGRYSESGGLEKQTALHLEIDAWYSEMLLQIQVEMLADIFGIDIGQ